MKASISYDAEGDVLYVKLYGLVIEHSSAMEDDDFVILNYSATGEIVGVQLLDVSRLTRLSWCANFRYDVPSWLYDEVAGWLSVRDVWNE